MKVTNRENRCSICNGREVLTIEDEEVVFSSLNFFDGNYVCKDKVECKQNLDAEKSKIKITIEDNKIRLSDGVDFFEVLKSE